MRERTYTVQGQMVLIISTVLGRTIELWLERARTCDTGTAQARIDALRLTN